MSIASLGDVNGSASRWSVCSLSSVAAEPAVDVFSVIVARSMLEDCLLCQCSPGASLLLSQLVPV